jgi:hypothetical protein
MTRREPEQPMDDRELLGPSGHAFPGEHEWLDLPDPPSDELAIEPGFTDRTLRALNAELGQPDDLLTPSVLAAFEVPAAAADFVARTLDAVRRDRREHWREMLARHIAPEPSPEFVAKTLAALAAERRADSALRSPFVAGERPTARWGWTSFAIAAAAALWLVLRAPERPPIELRLALAQPPAFAHAHAATPLPAVLTAMQHRADPAALPDGGPDGSWLLIEVNR